jgi:high-affinity iron transporter
MQCCNPKLNGGGGWGVFNSLFGWTNSATYGSVISYNLYWAAVIVGFLALGYNERRGHWPLMKRKGESSGAVAERGSLSSTSTPPEKVAEPVSNVREISA